MTTRRAVLRAVPIVLAIGLTACHSDREPLAEPVGPPGILARHECRIEPEAARQASRTMGSLSGTADWCSVADPCPKCPGLFVSGWDNPSCFWSASMWDPDGDSVDNGCENALAVAFAPELIAARDCNYDHSLRRQGGEYYFAAQRVAAPDGTPVLRIAYLPAYYLDCGTPRDQMSACLDFLGLDYCDGHTGDSEFIIVEARFDVASSHWTTQRVFLSAHCGATTGESCGWHAPAHFQWVDGRQLGAPVVWVAEGKHANYRTASACNSGAFGMDECRYNNARHRFPVLYGQQNIGSRAKPLRDCVTPFWGSSMPVPGAVECLWSAGKPRFDGWQGYTRNGGSPLYERHLAIYAGF